MTVRYARQESIPQLQGRRLAPVLVQSHARLEKHVMHRTLVLTVLWDTFLQLELLVSCVLLGSTLQ